MEIKGLDVLERQLQELGAELGAKLIARAARKAFRPVLDAAIAAVPEDSGILKKSIRMRAVVPASGDPVVALGIYIAPNKAKGQKGRIIARVKALRNKANRLDASWRWGFVEKGTKKMRAQPFLKPALIGNAEGVVSTFRDELAKAIQRTLKKQGKGKGR